jgi:chromosome partitioning protein
MTRTVAVANHKGGVAKTTTVASLGVALAELDRRVLLVDLDPEACLTFSLGLDQIDLSLHDVLLGRVPASLALHKTWEGPALLPATIDVVGSAATLLAAAGGELRLRSELEAASFGYDWVLLDCPPGLGPLTVAALTAADEVLIPLQCQPLPERGVGQLLDTIADVRGLTNPGLRVLGVLPTLFDGRSAHERAVLADVAERYALPVLHPAIPRSAKFAEAPLSGLSVLTAARRSRGAQAYREVARRLVAGTETGPE